MTTPRPDDYQDVLLAAEPVTPVAAAEDEVYVFPMSYAQQRIWFLDQFQPGSPFYNIPTAMRLTGRLDVDALRRAVNEIVRRHEALRTTFRAIRGEPCQIILPRLTIEVPVISLEELPAEEREAAARRLAREEARQPFDLARGPLLRFRLLRLAEEDHVALVTMHHIVSDGWSVSVFVRELSILYAAFSRGLPSPLPELPIQYADFADWQREWLQGEVLERQYGYWEQQLKGPVPIVELPSDRPRPPVQTANGATLQAKFPRVLVDRLHNLSRQEGATFFMTLLAAFKVLLHRYTGLADLPVGTPIANRTRAELEPLIGVFINTLVLRTRFEDLGGEIAFRELLRRVRQVALEAYDHQDLPFEMLVDRLQPERDMSHPTLFQTMFILQNAGLAAQEAPGLSLKVMEVDAGTATFDLTLSLAEQVDGLSVAAEYNTDLFDRSTIERLLGHFRTLLESIVANPDSAIGRLPMLPEEERRLVLYQWNRTQADYDTERCIHQLFEAQAAATPDAVAVVVPPLRSDNYTRPPAAHAATHRHAITYGELDRRANQLAHHLRGLGVGPETIVAVLAEKSVEMIVALLGILKAGGAYLPIDPSYPTDRIMHMLTDSATPVVLTQARLLEAASWRATVERLQVVRLDADWPLIAQHPATDQSTNLLTPSNLAYVIYTSGSTGQSKGVMVEHRSIVNAYLAWERAYALREPVKTHLQMASFSFDVFTGDLVRALCSGGTLVLCPRELLLEPAELYALMQREGITCAEFVPAVLRGLVQYLEETGQDLGFMQVLACGSDSWFVGEYRRFLKFCGPNTRLINSFGLTEATIDTCYFEARPGDPNLARLALDQIVPIGAPFANQTMVILDRYGEPTPIGVPGELYVGGHGVARGYLNRPELTAERFVPDPFSVSSNRLSVIGEPSTTTDHRSPIPGTGKPGLPVTDHRSPFTVHRLYRTGDLARWLADGVVQFLGRADDQVKIRGYRIEPGEIEAVFDRHPDLAGCAVVARPDPKGQNRLVAYYVVRRGLSDDAAPSPSELRRFAQERLPDYMVPSLFVRLEQMPLTPNGKVDRNGLPAPDWSQRAAEEAYVPPRTPLERQVADIWAEVLGVERVGAFDNFFELGGHSLLATQLVSRLRKAFDIDLPLRHIFELPTVAALSEQVAAALQRAAAPAGPAAPPLSPLPRDPITGVPAGPLPLSFAQQRLWFLDQLEPDSPLYNIPESVRLTGPLDVDLLRRALNTLVQRHESLRTSFTAADGVPGQVIAPRLTVELPVEDLTGLPPAERETAIVRLAAEEAQRPFKLNRPPLMRARLLRLAEQDHVFLLTTHHIISDNWSSNVLVREMAAVYDALRRGQPPEAVLPPLPIQYADFAAWQRAWLQGEALDAQLSYWRQKLAAAPPLLELPTDRPRPPVQTFRGAYQTFRLSREVSAALRRLTQEEGATLFMTLLAAFQTWLNRYAGQDDICVGTPIANRTRAELEGIVGFFVNTLVMRGDLSGDPTFRALLHRTRTTALEAYAHQDVPFEMVVDAVQPQRNLAHSPLFQVMFALQSSQAGAPALRPQATGDGLTITPVEAHSGTAKFDLTLFMTEEGDRLAGALEYNTDLFDHRTIERLLGHFQILLASIAADPDRRLSRLPLLSAAEERYLLVEWNATAAEFPEHLLAHQLIEQQAAATPDAVAVVGRSASGERERKEKRDREEERERGELGRLEELTYGELERRANQVAHHLRSLGVEPGEVVAICTERVVELPVAMLGVLKAGAAYLPIDPAYPPDRIAFMLADSGAKVLVTQEHVLRNSVLRTESADDPINTQSLMPDTRLVLLDRDWPTIAQHPPIYQSTDLSTPDALAYVIYTSGSTGRPKGTLVHHRGLVNYLTWCQRAYPLDRGVGAPVHSSISFDLTVTSLLAPLATGKAAFLIPDDLGIEALTTTLRAYGDFSLVKITPAHLELIGQQLRPEEAAGRTHAFIIGGEQLLAEHVAFWQRHAPDTLLVNEYGPTETVVGCAVFTADGRTPLQGAVPIGRPIINTRLYVLDRHMNLLPVGVPGELYIGGVGVAHGYLNRPELTAERFVPDPFAAETQRHAETETECLSPAPRLSVSASRLYRTGDLVRLRPDGVLEFLGRVDNQVKIRGFRVELGEIEAVLAQHPAVREAAVLLHEPVPGDRRLVAYISLRSALRSDDFSHHGLPETVEAVTARELRRFLGQTLPDYMIPATFVVLPGLPLNPNGKVDRKALARLEGVKLEAAADGAGFVPPATATEELLAAIWADLLSIERVSAADNFFDLGGHSLLATQLMARIQAAFDVELPLRALFEAPVLSDLAAAVDRAAAEGRQLAAPPLTPLPRGEDGQPLQPPPLSFGQQRLWFIDQLEPGNAIYNIPSAVRLSGPLHVEALVKALNDVIRRHEVLRTTFAQADGRPVAVVHGELRLDLPLTDLGSLPQAEQEAELQRLYAEEATAPFDLSRGPLLRGRIVRLADEEHVLLLTMHHIVSDAWSNGVLVAELAEGYAAHLEGRPAHLPPLPIQYADYAAWQRAWLDGEALQRQLTFWREQLADLPPLLELPTDRPRPPVQTYRGDRRTFRLAPELSRGLNSLARHAGVTPFMALLAAFQALLHRYTGQTAIPVGTPIAGRTRRETEPLIGFFINTLVLRGNLDDNPAFRELLRRTRETALAAYAHQDVPFETVVDHLQPERSLSYSPIFQVMFVLQNAAQSAARGVHGPGSRGPTALASGLEIAPLDMPATSSPFDMTLAMAEDGEGFAGAWEFNPDLFDGETIERMIGHFQTLLAAAVANPDSRVGDLPLLTPTELAQRATWNATARPEFLGRTVVDLFEVQAQRTPDATAVVMVGPSEERRELRELAKLTYAELDARANQLAHHLRGLGVGPETIVALMADRSPELIVGLLGILKAGGAYLPVDPHYPADRIAYMLQDSGVRVVVTQERLLETESWKLEGDRLQIVRLDADWPTIAQYSPIYQSTDLLTPNALAYVIYTSGTTGRPKGVMIHHEGLANTILGQVEGFDVRSACRVLQFASLSFDAAASEIFTSLTAGATLVLAPQEVLSSPPDLARLIREHGVTNVTLVPSVLALLPTEDTGRLRSVITAGERCGADLAARWMQWAQQPVEPGRLPRRFVNAYGPTETSIGPTLGVVADLPAGAASAPIGTPIPNIQTHILDRYGHPVPVGVPGELCIGGVGVGRGYLNRPDLTAEKFVPDPFVVIGKRLPVNGPEALADSLPHGADQSPITGHGLPTTGHRLYRTGDLARYLPDGRIEILGRVDQQVKLRGFRIELGEIEAALREHPQVLDAAAVVQAPAPGNQRLVAFVTLRSDGFSRQSLRDFLRQRLPDYMVPTAIVPMDALPLTPNGKVDRRRLASWDIGAVEAETEHVAPRTPTEEILAALWAELLAVPRVGATDNFFALGGHSLLATQLVSRLRDAFDVELPLRTLFEAPTLAELAHAVDVARQTRRGFAAPPLTPMPRAPEDEGLPALRPPLSFAQQRLWFLDQLEPNTPLYNLPAAVRLTGRLDVDALHRALVALVQRHEALRTTLAAEDGEAYQVIAPASAAEGLVALPVDDLSALAEAEREAAARRLAVEEARRPFDLTRGPLLRCRLLRLADEEHVVLLTMHHIVSDGWSVGVLIRELAALYLAFVEGAPPALPDLPVQYADYAYWQRNWLQGEALEAQLRYWREELAGLPPLLELPTDRPRPPIPSYRGGTVEFTLPPELATTLKGLSRREGATLFMTLLAGFQALLHRYSGQDDMAVGTPIAGRTQRATEGLIGFFVNTLVLRGRLGDNPTFRELLRRTRESALGAYAHQDLPFETVVDALAPVRDMSHSPLFQVVFTMQNQPLAGMGLPGLRLEPIQADAGVAKFDLTLSMVEDAAGGLSAALEYATDLFDRSTIERMAGHLRTLLEAIAADPDRRIGDLPLLTPAEAQQILVAWTATDAAFPADRTVVDLFEEWAVRTPDAVALEFVAEPTASPAVRFTYAELDARANQLAHHLRGLGVGPETIVALMADRSPELIVGLLGILKAGGAYLPVDPHYPADRIAYMLQDSGVRVVVSQERLLETGNWKLEGDRLQIVRLDTDWPTIAQHSPIYRSTDLPTPDALVYVIYTSGSTGRPKGVMVAHCGLTNLVTAQIAGFRVPPGSRVLQFASVSFDAAASEIFMALAGGSTLVLAPQAVLASVPDLAALLAAQRISVVTLPPSVLSVLPDAGLAGLTSLISAGERCPTDLAQRWARGRHFVNAYGPTEATIGPTMYPVTDLPAALSSAPIGRPIPNMRLYLLDRYGQPVPVGVPGEIYIGGVGVARGYLNRPDLTAERFLPNPFAAETQRHGETEAERLSPAPRLSVSASRIYRTGDLARWLPDGNIEYLGRVDFQVKVRGFRIELGEIETVLREHPAVAEAAVLAKETADGDRRLVAYVALTPTLSPGERGLDVAELREHLRRRLPEYMVPAVFVPLEAMPLTPNGKVDRRALAALAEAGRTAAGAYVEPRTDDERRLAKVWAQVLGVERVGIHDNFFDLGGDSILSLRLIARARQAGFHFTPRQLFERPTVAALLATPAAEPTAAAEDELAGAGPLPLTPVQCWFFDHHPLAPHHFNTSMLRTVWGEVDLPRLEQAINALVAHHDALRLRFHRTDDGWQAEVAESAFVPLERFDLSTTPAAQRSAALEAIASRLQASFDLALGPLVRLAYFDMGADEPGRLLLIFHHLVADGVSWRILLEDLATAYAQLGRGLAPSLPKGSASFRSWATRLAAYAQTPAAQAELSFWQSLADADAQPTPLPVDFPAGRNTYGSTDELTLALSEAQTSVLLQRVPAHFGASIHAVLLAALARALAPWTGSRRLWVETEGHGREEVLPGVDLAHTVGWFTSIYPALVDLGRTDDLTAALRQADAALRQIPARGVGYGILRYLSADADVRARMARLPQPPINFNYLGQFQTPAVEDAGQLLLGPAPESPGPEQAPEEERPALLYVVGIVTGGALQLRWLYSRNLHRRETIQRLAEATLAELQQIIQAVQDATT